MTIDVLTYNALNKENQPSRTCSIQLDTCISNLNCQCTTFLSSINSSAPQVLSSKMVRSELWAAIPTTPTDGSSWVSGFKVCDTSGFFRCGACCEWVVPAGVTCARFQIWGAGAQSGAAGCCGGSPFGGSGAYASVIIPVTQGNAYTLCAGCAFCCYSQQNTAGNSNGCQSFVTGTGLTNFCAMGGIGSLCQELIDRNTYYSQSTPIPNPGSWSYLGFALCGTGSSFCHPQVTTPYSYNGCLTCGGGFFASPWMIYQTEHSSALPYGSATCGTVFGIRGSYPEVCLNLSCMCGYMKNPPIYGYESSSQCCFCWSGATSCGGNYCSTSATFGSVTPSLQIPGSGGYGMQVSGACVAICGDSGRMGMVCVSFK